MTDRGYWERRGTPTTVAVLDGIFEIVHGLDPALELKYNKFYVGLAKDGQPHSFVISRPQKNALMLTIRLQRLASDARPRTASSNSGTWNSTIFSGLPIGTSILYRLTSSGAHSGCADRYARFWLMTCPWGSNFGQARLPGGHPSGRQSDDQGQPDSWRNVHLWRVRELLNGLRSAG